MNKEAMKRVLAPAKLNLRLRVVGQRPDGYHELVSIMVPVSLFDQVECQLTPGTGISMVCSGYPVPVQEDNLGFRAAKAFLARTGLDRRVTLSLHKKIPVAAGLGGGSSDAAHVLLCLNDMCPTPLGHEDLSQMAKDLGADVPFFLFSRPAMATGIGDVLEFLEPWPKIWYVVIKPPFSVSTAWVYGQWDCAGHGELGLTSSEYHFIKDILQKRPLDLGRLLLNDLERVTAREYPAITRIKKALMEAGAQGALMSGSGPSVYGLFGNEQEALHARRIIASQGIGEAFAVEGLG